MPVKSLVEPSLEQAASFVQEAISKRNLAIVIGNCRVEYEGRASSQLDWGERLLIIKADGAVMVHRPVNYEPVTWKPPGCVFQVEASSSLLKIRAVRLQPREVLNILFDRVFQVSVASLKDYGEFSMYVTELDMKKAILTCPDLLEEGFKPISSEKDMGESGFIDLFGEDSKGNLVVVELKRNPAGKEAILQLDRYIRALKEKTSKPIRGIIAAPELRKDAQPLLASLKLEFKPIQLKKCYEVLKLEKDRKLSDYL